MSDRVLTIDVGNTTTQLGVFEGNHLILSFRLASTHTRTVDEAILLFRQILADASIDPESLSGSVYASVVPMLTPLIEMAVRRITGQSPIAATHHSKLTVTLDVPRPEQIGADRIANAEAFWNEYHQTGVVVDFGTATTFDVISNHGAYIGGAIAPGIETSGNQLAQKAAQLFKVSIVKPDSPIGKTTEDALKSGMFYSAIGAVDYVVEQIVANLPDSPKVIATGGLAQVIAPGSRMIDSVEPELTIRGLLRIHQLNTHAS